MSSGAIVASWGAALLSIDPFTAFPSVDWIEVGGWSAFVSLSILIVTGAFREWWVPGVRYRRTETALEKSLDTTKLVVKQNEQLIQVNPLTQILLDERVPQKRDARGKVDPDAGGVR